MQTQGCSLQILEKIPWQLKVRTDTLQKTVVGLPLTISMSLTVRSTFRHSDNLMIDGVLQVLVFVVRIPQISRLNFFVYCSCKIIIICRLVAISSFSFELESSVSFEDLTALPSISFFMSAFFFSRVFTFIWFAGRSCSLFVRLSWPGRIRVIFAVHCNYF